VGSRIRSMGSEGSASPSDGLPLVNAYWVLDTTWVPRALLLGLGHRGAHPYPSLTILSWGDCQTLGKPAFKPLDRRGFRTHGSFSEKAPSERVGCLLCTEDGHTFLGGFLREVEQVLQQLRPDWTFCRG
jgi:hypothetical protein